MTAGIFGFSLGSNLVLLLGAAALAIGGATFISRGLNVRKELVAARATLVAPWSANRNALVGGKASAADPELSYTYGPFDREFARHLKRVGISAPNVHHTFLLSRIIAAALAAVMAYALFGHLSFFASHALLRILLGGAGAIVGCFVPLLIVQSMMAARLKTMVSGLPDALELLVICAEAGLSLEAGIDRVVTELARTQPELAEELALTSADLKILPDSSEALTRLADRINQKNFRSVVTTLTQTMRYGTPLADALRAVASEMRNDSLVHLEERANRLPALLTVPMMLFILPTIFLIIGGPAILRLMDLFLR